MTVKKEGMMTMGVGVTLGLELAEMSRQEDTEEKYPGVVWSRFLFCHF